jgi:hypothetical protein
MGGLATAWNNWLPKKNTKIIDYTGTALQALQLTTPNNYWLESTQLHLNPNSDPIHQKYSALFNSIQFNSKVFLLDEKIKIHILCYK